MKKPGLKAALVALKIAVSAALLAVLFSRADTSSMLEQFRQMNLAWTAAALAMYGAMLIVSAWRWRLLLRIQEVSVGFGRLTQSFLVATFFNNFLPSNIGGDVVRVADTASYARSKTLATTVVLLDRVLGLVALLAVAAAASALAFYAGVHLRGMQYVWGALTAIVIGLVFVLRHPARIGRATGRFAAGRAAGVHRRFQSLLDAMARFGGQPRRLWSAFVGAIAVQLLLVLFYICAAHSLAVPLPLLAASVIVPVSLAVQMVPVSINGFGVREAVFAFFFASLGLDVSSALTLSLGSAALIMLFSLSGGVVFLLRARGLLPVAEAA
ncbi:lysylphosphatidylglycerol synthase transmembrane domain-containing protein [soil metagenome]